MNHDLSSEDKREWIERVQFGLRMGQGSIADVNELRELLLEDQEARLIYLETNQLDSMLETAGLRSLPEAPPRGAFPELRRDRVISALVGAGIAALVMVMLILGWNGIRGFRTESANSGAEDPPVASFLSGLNAIIGGEAARGSHVFREGAVPLDHGIAHLAFRNGARIVLEGKCGFEIVDEKSVILSHGKMWAHCPMEARGFTVRTPDGRKIIDLGTEFGVEVTSDGETDIHVFDGLVDVADPRGGKQTVRAGEALRWSGGVESASSGKADHDKFVTADTLAQRRLQAHHARMLARRDLLLYYDFTETDGGVVRNHVPGADERTHGRVVGATPVAGRTQGADALQFEHPGDALSFELDRADQIEELTIALWVKIDRFDQFLSALLNSNGWDVGAIHFQVTRDGNMRAGISGGAAYESPSGCVRPGQWQLLAVTWDFKAREARLFADGIALHSARIPNSGPERFILDPQFGPSQVGSWGGRPPANANESRELKGRVDEVMIFDHALSDEDLADLYQAGKP